MKSLKIITVCLVLFGTAQWSCSPRLVKVFATGGEVVYSSSTYKQEDDPCKQTINYAPSEKYPHHLPIRYVKVRFLIMQAVPNDPHTLSPEEAGPYVEKLLGITNYKQTLLEPMNLPVGNSTPVLPKNYRFVLYKDPARPDDTGIKFVVDSSLAYFNYKTSNNGHYDRRAFDKYAEYKDEVLNIVIHEHHPDSVKSATYKQSSTGTGFSNFIKMVGSKLYLDTVWHQDGSMEVVGHKAGLVLHETGHSFGLAHTWAGSDGCDDTPNHPNCFDHNTDRCPDGIYSNNMMDYNNRQDAVTPCQLGIINYSFSRIGSAQRQYLVPVWCEYKPDSARVIYGNDVEWNGAMDLEGDVIIQNGGVLTVRCRLALPAGARIIVKPKGTLILDGAHVTNLCNEQWEGIELWGNGKDRGSIMVYGHPIIDHAKNPISLSSGNTP